jgi:excisionase family DNA binding protein
VKGEDRVTWTVRETAERLGITPSTAYAYVESGVLPAVRLGRRLLIPRAAVLALVDRAMGQWGGPDVA